MYIGLRKYISMQVSTTQVFQSLHVSELGCSSPDIKNCSSDFGNSSICLTCFTQSLKRDKTRLAGTSVSGQISRLLYTVCPSRVPILIATVVTYQYFSLHCHLGLWFYGAVVVLNVLGYNDTITSLHFIFRDLI